MLLDNGYDRMYIHIPTLKGFPFRENLTYAFLLDSCARFHSIVHRREATKFEVFPIELQGSNKCSAVRFYAHDLRDIPRRCLSTVDRPYNEILRIIHPDGIRRITDYGTSVTNTACTTSCMLLISLALAKRFSLGRLLHQKW